MNMTNVYELKPSRPQIDVPIPWRMRKLPRDSRGFIVPYFVVWFENGKPAPRGIGEPDFRVLDPARWADCVNNRKCWICGDPLGSFHSYVIGPMCVVNRTTSEPANHLDCATYAALVCPFLSRPRMRRNDNEIPAHKEAPGVPLSRNPGVAVIWTSKGQGQVFRAGQGNAGYLIRLRAPESVAWFREGRLATRAEALESINSGLPALKEIAEQEGKGAPAELDRFLDLALRYLPEERPA